jgi:uncharacterized heparinase superfamily protein
VSGAWQPPVARAPSLTGRGSFRFLNEAGDLSEIGWNGNQRSSLWRYNQHYFDDLSARGAGARQAWHAELLEDWLASNQPGKGVGWDPYPSSLRIVNWLKWQLAGNALGHVALGSLAMQARGVAGRLEWHLLGNHLLANAKALVFAGLAFDGGEARGWLETGLDVLGRELEEQVLGDGGHFELSPMYHGIILEDLLDLCNAAGAWAGRIDTVVADRWHERAGAMLAWLQSMTHPDGGIGFFNDAAFGIAPTTRELVDYAARIGISVRVPARVDLAAGGALTRLADSGYIRLDAPAATALLDVARLGPDYLLGHAHADTLSFELSVAGQRAVVNGGTSRYGLGIERCAERGTAAHSTVQVDGQDSSEVWSGFRVARRAYPFALRVEEPGEECVVTCSHDGYVRLPGKPVHCRNWSWGRSSLVVDDSVSGSFGSAVARFMLHPDVCLEAQAPGTWNVRLAGGHSLLVEVIAGDAMVEAGRYAPEFGLVRATQCLSVRLVKGRSRVRLAWH